MKVDRNILLFLWRWKLVSSTALAARFFPGLTTSAVNMRLEDVRKKKLIYPYYMNTTEAKVLWSLTAKGFKEAKVLLPALVEDGFRSEHPLHDFYVTTIHIGEWLGGVPDGCEVFSEQELRRYDPARYPKWVPSTTLHRPDGYWKIQLPEGTVVAALEVELKIKSDSKYGVVAQFYKDHPGVSRVIWVVRTMANAEAIREALKSSSPSNIGMHTFILLPDFLTKGWQAPILFGFEAGESLSCLLLHHRRESFEKSFVFSMLDTRKWPSITKVSAGFSNSSISPLAGPARSLPGLVPNHDFTKQTGLPRPLIPQTNTRRKTQ